MKMRSNLSLQMARSVADELHAGRTNPECLPTTVKELSGFFLDCLDTWEDWAKTSLQYDEALRKVERLSEAGRYALLSPDDREALHEAVQSLRRFGRPPPARFEPPVADICLQCQHARAAHPTQDQEHGPVCMGVYE